MTCYNHLRRRSSSSAVVLPNHHHPVIAMIIYLLIATTLCLISQTMIIPVVMAGAGSTTTTSATTMVPYNEHHNHDMERVLQVRHVLNAELAHVLNGRRSKEFAKLYRPGRDRIDLAYTIGSTHGRSSSNKKGEEETETEKSTATATAATTTGSSSTRGGSTSTSTTAIVDSKRRIDKRVLEVLKRMETQDSLRPPSLLTLTCRATKLTWNFAPCTLTSGLAFCSSWYRRKVWYGIVSRCLARSGPAFIKWGQWASTRTDMFPEELCSELSTLHASAPSHKWKVTQDTVEKALDLPKGTLLDVFHTFDEQPMASGSIAQVHRAVLKADIDASSSSAGMGGKADEVLLLEDSPSSTAGSSTTTTTMTTVTNTAQRKKNKLYQNLVATFGKYGSYHTSPTGTTVAVKVRHPNVAELIDYDFRLMLKLADIIDTIPALRWLNVRSSVEQFSHTMAAQAHLDVEAHHLEVLNYNFRKWGTVGFPKPFFSSSDVIIETFERGEIVTSILDKYDDLAGEEEVEVDNREDDSGDDVQQQQPIIRTRRLAAHDVVPLPFARFLVGNGLSIYLKMLLVDNIMHADLHPGNIMVSTDNAGEGPMDVQGSSGGGDAGSEPQWNMILVDAGMVAHLDDEESENFIGLLASLGEGSGRAATDCVLRFSDNDVLLDDDEKAAFANDMEALFLTNCRGYGTNVDFGEVLRDILNLIRKHRVRIDANYATLVINALCVEGLARRVAPEYNLLDASKPLLQSFSKFNRSGNGRVSKAKQALLRVWMPIMYVRKELGDRSFFRRQKKRSQSKGGSGIVASWKKGGRQFLITLLANGIVLGGTLTVALSLSDKVGGLGGGSIPFLPPPLGNATRTGTATAPIGSS